MDLKALIRDVPDFPKPGIVFRDITTLVGNARGFREAVGAIADHYRGARLDAVLGVESRGFIFGAAVAYRLGVGFVPARKPGKLPAETERAEYALEYGVDGVEVHKDGVARGQRILIVDDLLATGGTAAAAADLVERLGGIVVAVAFVVELAFLRGREKLSGREVFALVQYESE